jgi:hypothetical protein
LFTNIFASFDLAAITPIVAAAGLIIAAILGAFAWKKGLGGGM